MFVCEFLEYYDEFIFFLIIFYVVVFRKFFFICDIIFLNLLNGMVKDKRLGFIYLCVEGLNDFNIV